MVSSECPRRRFCTNAWPAAIVRAERIFFQSAHRAKPCLEPTVISFYDVVRVLLDDVPRSRRDVIKHARIDRCPVGRDLERNAAEGHRPGEEGTRSSAVAALGDEDVYDLATLVDRSVEVGPSAGDLDVGLIREPPIARGMARRSSSIDELTRERLNPTVDRHMIDLDAALRE